MSRPADTDSPRRNFAESFRPFGRLKPRRPCAPSCTRTCCPFRKPARFPRVPGRSVRIERSADEEHRHRRGKRGPKVRPQVCDSPGVADVRNREVRQAAEERGVRLAPNLLPSRGGRARRAPHREINCGGRRPPAARDRGVGQLPEVAAKHCEIDTGEPSDLLPRGERIAGEALKVELPERDRSPLSRRRVDSLDALRISCEFLEDRPNGPEKGGHHPGEKRRALDHPVDLNEDFLVVAREPLHVVRAGDSEEDRAVDRAFEETDRRKREVRSIASGEETYLRSAEGPPQVIDVPRALDRVVRPEIHAARGPVVPALGRALPERREHEPRIHRTVERQVEPARAVEPRLRKAHAALIEGDYVGELRDVPKERKERPLGVLDSRAARAAREPHDRRAGPRSCGFETDESELDRRASRPRAVLEDRQPPELDRDGLRAVGRLQSDRFEAKGAGSGVRCGGGILRETSGGGGEETQEK